MADRKVSRDAVTGEWVSDEYAAQNPDTTVTETIPDDEAPASVVTLEDVAQALRPDHID